MKTTSTEAAKAGEWLKHGGERDCPVALTSVVEIERRDGSIEVGPAGYWHSPFDYQNSWKHDGGLCDIVRYRAQETL